jgi:hypothetical protein
VSQLPASATLDCLPADSPSTRYVQVTLRPAVSWPVCLGVKPPFEVQDQIFVSVRQLRVCTCGAPSLTRGRVSRLQLPVALASAAILGFEFCETHEHILLSQIRHSPNLEAQIPVFIYPRYTMAHLHSLVQGCPFVASYDSQQGYGGGIRTPTGVCGSEPGV